MSGLRAIFHVSIQHGVTILKEYFLNVPRVRRMYLGYSTVRRYLSLTLSQNFLLRTSCSIVRLLTHH